MTEATRPALMPADTPAYMADAWAGCVVWAGGQPEVVAAFQAETGNRYTPPTDAIEAAIDKATGRDAEFCRAFIEWVNIRIWGPIGNDDSENGQVSNNRSGMGGLCKGPSAG